MKDRRMCKDCAAALALLNKHLKGREYTNLDDALRNMLQAFISMRDSKRTEQEVYEYLWKKLGRFEPTDPDLRSDFDGCLSEIAGQISFGVAV